jgi:hypothetical protein
MKSIHIQATALAAAAVLAVALLLWFTAGGGRTPILPVDDARVLELPPPGEPLVLSWEPAPGTGLTYQVEIIEADTGLPALSGLTSETVWSPGPAADLLDREKKWLWRVNAASR